MPRAFRGLVESARHPVRLELLPPHHQEAQSNLPMSPAQVAGIWHPGWIQARPWRMAREQGGGSYFDDDPNLSTQQPFWPNPWSLCSSLAPHPFKRHKAQARLPTQQNGKPRLREGFCTVSPLHDPALRGWGWGLSPAHPPTK